METETVVHGSERSHDVPEVRFLHFNDVYHVEAGSRDPVGGAARFQTVCNYYRNDETFKGQPKLLNFFSGDVYNPSLESSVTKGSHMVPVMNNFGIDVSCAGVKLAYLHAVNNHDFDFGVSQFEHLAKQCHFPWLLANVIDPANGDDIPLGRAKKTHMLTTSNGFKIGLIGIGEREWLGTINSLPPNLEYRSASETVKRLAPGLREQGADMVIALTHAREPNDLKLAKNLPPGLVDMILGGHDHIYKHMIVNDIHILRSGTDFKQLSYIKAWRVDGESKAWDFEIIRRDIIRSIPEDPTAAALVDRLTAALKQKLEKPIGYTSAPLDARFSTVRLQESNIGNFVCDLMRLHYQADCAIMAAGTIRGDQIYPPGVLKLKDIMDCFPFEDPVMVLRLKGKAVLDALENGVSTYPALEGRFPQVSNIYFEFDKNAPRNSRVKNVTLGGEALNPEKDYTMATRGYMARGKDGYDSLLGESEGGIAEEVVNEENGILISMILRQYFMSLKVLGRWKRLGNNMNRHWSHVQGDLHTIHPVKISPQPSPADGEKNFNFNVVHESAIAEEDESHEAVNANTFQFKNRRRQSTFVNGTAIDSDSEDDDDHLHPENATMLSPSSAARTTAPKRAPSVNMMMMSQQERRLSVMRKVSRKWWRLTGLPGHPSLVNEEAEFSAMWTKGIAPRLEGRIREISCEAS